MLKELKKIKKICGRIEKGVEIIGFFKELAKREGIAAGEIRAIGGFLSVTLGEYEPEMNRYKTLFEGEGFFEVVSLMGNISMKDNEPVIHLHAGISFLDKEGAPRMMGGHLLKGEVFLIEFFIDNFPGDSLKREFDPETSLYIWK